MQNIVKKTKRHLIKQNKNNKTKKKESVKKCVIEKTDRVLFGSGGSTAIVLITKNNKVYKLFTLYYMSNDNNINLNLKLQNSIVNNEINIYKLITKNVINKNISNHFVEFLGINDCHNVQELFKECPKKYTQFLQVDDSKKSRICADYYRNYPIEEIENNYKVMELEYCNYSCAEFIFDISQLAIDQMKLYLDIFFFQIIHTLLSVKKVYPYFIHNDLFMRNILGTREKDDGKFYEYKFNNKRYFVPQKLFFPKIGDFGLTNLNAQYKNVRLYKNDYKDFYNLLYDVYDGANLGAESLSSLCNNNAAKKTFVKEYFSTFFDVDVIDEYKKKSPNQMNWDWYNVLDKDFLNSINLRKPENLLNDYFHEIFSKPKKNKNRREKEQNLKKEPKKLKSFVEVLNGLIK